MTSTAESEGGIIISANSGTINLYSPGAAPAAPPALAPQPSLAAFPIIPGPIPDEAAYGLARRLGGALYYGITGKCPTKAASPSAGFIAVPSQAYAIVPAASAPQPAAAPQVIYLQAAPAASPQASASAPMIYAAPEAPKKCRLFGGGR